MEDGMSTDGTEVGFSKMLRAAKKLGDTMQVLQAVQVLGDGEEAVCAGAGRAARGGSGSGFVAGSYKGKTGIVQKLTPQKAHVALLDVLYDTHDTLDLRWA